MVNGRNESDLVRASSGAILARILVQNSPFFAQFTAKPSLVVALQQSGVTATDQSPLFLFFDAWLDKVVLSVTPLRLGHLFSAFSCTFFFDFCNQFQFFNMVSFLVLILLHFSF